MDLRFKFGLLRARIQNPVVTGIPCVRFDDSVANHQKGYRTRFALEQVMAFQFADASTFKKATGIFHSIGLA